MRRRRATYAAFALAALTVGMPRLARAGSLEPTPERLVVQPPGLPPGQTCQSVAADPGAIVAAGLNPRDYPCLPDNAAFRNLVSELGFAIAPTAFHPARTTGLGGFVLSLDASYTHVNADAASVASNGAFTEYWHLGTRGSQDATTKTYSAVHAHPPSILQIYGLRARKGLPFGFELGASAGYIASSPLWVWGGDARWSLLEGLRKGTWAYVPDLSVGVGGRTLTGSSKLNLSTVGIDVKVSKPFTVGGAAQLVPSLGYQRLFIFGSSNVVDTTPNVDALRQCGYEGTSDAGTPICRNKLPNGDGASTDFANDVSFHKVVVHRHRAMLGLNYRYEVLWLGSQLAFDLTDPKNENDVVGSRQWTLTFEGGVHF